MYVMWVGLGHRHYNLEENVMCGQSYICVSHFFFLLSFVTQDTGANNEVRLLGLVLVRVCMAS